MRKPTYALVVSSGTMDQQQVSTLIKKKINPTELGLQDVVMRPGKQGVIITTTSKEASGRLETQLQQKMRNVQVKRPKENKYPIKLIGVDEEEDADSLPEKIIGQNNLLCDPEDMVVRKTWKGKQGTTVVLGLSKKGLEALRNKTHLNIGWNRCRFYDHFYLPRCTRCAEHGHSSNECDSPNRCVKCGSQGHHPDNCERGLHCYACEKENRTPSRAHSMMSWECPVFLEKLEAEKKRVIARLT